MERLWQCVLCYSVVERWPRGLWRRSRKAVPDCIGTWVQIPPSPPRGSHVAMNTGFTERCWSGRTGATGNRVGEQSSRGFESHPLRLVPPSRIIHLGPIRLRIALSQLQLWPNSWYTRVCRSLHKSCAIHAAAWDGSWEINDKPFCQPTGFCCGGPQCEVPGKVLRR